jgi:hypothetical protein
MERVINEPTISVCIIAFFVLVYLTLYILAVIICTTRFNTFFPYSAFTCFERILVLTRLLLYAILTDWLSRKLTAFTARYELNL